MPSIPIGTWLINWGSRPFLLLWSMTRPWPGLRLMRSWNNSCWKRGLKENERFAQVYFRDHHAVTPPSPGKARRRPHPPYSRDGPGAPRPSAPAGARGSSSSPEPGGSPPCWGRGYLPGCCPWHSSSGVFLIDIIGQV